MFAQLLLIFVLVSSLAGDLRAAPLLLPFVLKAVVGQSACGVNKLEENSQNFRHPLPSWQLH